MTSSALEQKAFLFMLIAVTVAFGVILWPFAGAVFWGSVLAILFAPVQRRLLRAMGPRPTLAALVTLLLVLVIVILPVALITASLVREGTALYGKLQSGDIDFGVYFQQIVASLPRQVTALLDHFGLSDAGELQQKITSTLAQGSKTIATQVLSIGQNTFDFVVSFFIMLYLLFFLVRDGSMLGVRIRDAIPLNPAHKRDLFSKFLTVIRATVKGNIAVAAAQGFLGGVALMIVGVHSPVLLGVLMAFLSLLPAVGAAIVWGPIALYFLAISAWWQAITLIFIGVFVIGLVDNILRPLLVGKDTKMPDYVVLIATIGGMAVFGLNGFVIGPVIAAMFIAVWTIFSQSKRDVQGVGAVLDHEAARPLPGTAPGVPPTGGRR